MRLRPSIILTALACARIAFGYQFQTVATLATDLSSRFGLSYAQLGALIGSYMISGFIVALPLGLIGRRLGEGRVLMVGLALMTAGCVYSALAATAAGIGLGRAAAGIGAVAMIVLQNKIIAEWFSGARFMLAISVSVCAFPVGMGLAQLLLPWVLQGRGLSAALLTDAMPAGLALFLFLGSHAEPPHAAPVPRRFSLPSPRECLLLLIAGCGWMVYTAGFAAWASYLPASLSLRGFSLAAIGTTMTIATWGNVPATMAGGGLAARFGGLNIFLAGTIFLSIGMAGSALAGWPVVWAVFIGILGSIQPGVLMAIGTLSARPENRAVGMGIFYTLYYLGGTVAPALCGVAADYAGRPEAGILAAAALSALAIPIYLLHRALAAHETMLVRA